MGRMSNILRTLRGAESEVERLEREVARWTTEAENRRRELADLERDSGAAVLAHDPASAVRELTIRQMDLRTWIVGAQGASAAAEEQLVLARWDLDEARAVEMRDQAAKFTATAEAHQAKVTTLLAQLRELDGVDYVPFEPSKEDIQSGMFNDGHFSWEVPHGTVLWDPVQPLLDEASRLEQRVAAERAAAARAVAPVVPTASILVPAWDDVDSESQVSCRISEGVGSATFEVSTSGQYGGIEVVTLPDQDGSRMWGKRVKLQAGGGSAKVTCGGAVLAREVRPGSLMANGTQSVWVDYSRCPSCRSTAPVTKRAKTESSDATKGAVLAIACQNGCDVDMTKHAAAISS